MKQPELLSLRDYFASCALSAMPIRINAYGTGADEQRMEETRESARRAYEVADAMLAERAKK